MLHRSSNPSFLACVSVVCFSLVLIVLMMCFCFFSLSFMFVFLRVSCVLFLQKGGEYILEISKINAGGWVQKD